ncbi:MAG: amidohydrolase family protein [Bacteroidota bacterium]
MRKISADIIFPIDQAPIKEGVIVLEEDGTILAVDHRKDHDMAGVAIHKGVITPGFINAHCHLELSHMKGMVDTGTTLIPFITSVVSHREVAEEAIMAAIEAGDREMYENGIVAVGDISNKVDTAAQKMRSPIRYYTFVEMFDFMQADWTDREYDKYKAVYEAQASSQGNQKSVVPHAPYSVSADLFHRINELNKGQNRTVSIHNEETLAENQLFLEKKGGFLDFYKGFGISLDAFSPTGQTSIHYALKHMDPDCRTLFVHNTLSTSEDIEAAHRWSDHCYWATCPNANLYIENRLPNYQLFIDANARMTIGTDSLTSNWQLCILEEMKTIARYQSYVSFEQLIRWATLNGAEALGMEAELGSITPGKRPGLNLIDLGEDLLLKGHHQVVNLMI